MKGERSKALTSLETGIIVGIILGSLATFIILDYSQKNINLYTGFPSILSSSSTTSITQPPSGTATGTTREAIFGKEVSLILPAVDDNGKGVTTRLTVQAKPGAGKVLIDVNNLFFFVDTQNSIKTAREVAQNITGIDFSKVDLIYSIDANVSAVEGPSAGAALAIASIAAVENKSVNSSVVITGTIEPDGTIGPIGAVLEKAQAAKSVGATLFLVPQGQGTSSTYKPIQQCETIGSLIYCTTEYRGTKTDISSSVGITVKEVSTVNDALKYFLI